MPQIFAAAPKVMLSITLNGADIGQASTIAVIPGTTWAQLKDSITIVSTKPNETFKCFSLKVNGDAIPDDTVINTNTRIYVVYNSADNPGTNSDVKITVDTKGGVPETKAFYVPGGSTFGSIKHKLITPYKDDSQFMGWEIA